MMQGFEKINGLIIIVPALIALHSFISGSLGSRLGSAVHLGLAHLEKILAPETKINANVSILLSCPTALLLGFFGYLSFILLGLDAIHFI